MAVWQITRSGIPIGITFHTNRFDCAAVAALMVTGGTLGASELDAGRRVPEFPHGGDDAWLQEHFGMNWNCLLNSIDGADFAACLRSFAGGSGAIDPTVRRAWSMASEFEYQAA